MPEPLSNIAKRFPSVSVTGLWLGPAAFLAMLWLGAGLDPENPLVGRMAAIALLMAIWWITEAVPLAATALVPLVLFPLTGIMSGVDVAPVYFNYIIFLFLGGFMIALAMERWNLHRRIALRIIAFTGTKPSRLVLGFMLATAFLSMWISNTATSIMMLAIGLAVIKQEEETFGAEATAPLSAALLLGIAYSASVGGIATLVGTPPNLALVRLFEIGFPGAEEAGYRIAFGQWMLLGVPLSAVMLVVVWLVLTRVCHRCPDHLELAPDVIREERRSLGPMGFEEKAVAAVFVGTAVLWIFRADLHVGNFTLPGGRACCPSAASSTTAPWPWPWP